MEVTGQPAAAQHIARTWLSRAPAWLPPVALNAALVAALLIWDPQVRDLAAQSYRVELFEREGFAIWNGSWYGGHYTLTYSVLFPPLAALLTPQLVGALAAVVSTYLFDRLVRARWGERARWASLWFALGAAAMVANGNLSFALGVAFGLAALGALVGGRAGVAIAAGLACGLASPVAAVFCALVAGAGFAVASPDRRRAALATAAAALLPVLLLNLAFSEKGIQPFSLRSFVEVLLWAGAALYLLRSARGERPVRVAIGVYVALVTAVLLIPNALGDNVARLASFFGGPVLLAGLLAHPLGRPRGAVVLVAVVALGWSAYWQLTDAVDELGDATGDPSVEAAYYEPLAQWLRAHGGERARIEVPPTVNTWEAAYLAPEFNLARGWLRQADRARNELFFEGSLETDEYREWLRDLAVRYVALPDAPIHRYAEAERELILSRPRYLEPAASFGNWRVWRVQGSRPLVSAKGSAAGRLLALEPQAFSLRVERPGRFLVRVRENPYWQISTGEACVGASDGWTAVRADRPGLIRAEIDFSLEAAWRSATGSVARC